jgi:hypothetical protein
MMLVIGNVYYVDFKDKTQTKKKLVPDIPLSEAALTKQKLDRLQSSIERINKLCEELRLGTLPSDIKE